MPVRLRDSIYVRSVILTTVLIAMIVGFLTFYFLMRRSDALEADSRTRASMYGDLLSDQLRSAIAFSDHETAREVMNALDADPDVVSAVLFDDQGTALIAEGQPSPWVTRAARGVRRPQVLRWNDRMAVVSPVTSLEGPRGTLVIELSLARVLADRASITRTAVGLALAVIVIGVLLSSLIARRFAGRLRAIADVACDVAAGSPRLDKVPIEAWDEIGVLGSAFNHMLTQLQDEKQRLQATVKELRRAEDRLAQSNRDLEHRVHARTAELRSANAQLVTETARRSQMEIELRQSQKLESVGRLAAGVAHEINTPIQFVSNSVDFVRGTTIALLDAVEAQQRALTSIANGTPSEALLSAAYRAVEIADVEFAREELPLALERTVDGLERVAVIVRSMKVFSHQNAAMTAIDLNRAVASTLTIARHEFKSIAEVETDFGALPDVVCEGGEINQVLLNLLLNAAHAIGDKVKGTLHKGTIRVRTWHESAFACVSIADSGCGIPTDVRDRIYDPFFTTKAVGRGTGQGLAIARSVIDKHAGHLAFESEVGRGTVFVIKIPVCPQAKGRVAA